MVSRSKGVSTVVQKFGRAIVGTTMVPIAFGGVYRTPQASGAQALRVRAGDAADTADGAGAREVTIQGLDENWMEQTVTLATAGTSAGPLSTVTFTRIYRAWVSASGTYATQSAGSHADDIVVEDSGGNAWLTIGVVDFPKGQTDIGCISIPKGRVAYVRDILFSVAGTKDARVLGFRRQGIDDTAAPYEAMRAFMNLEAITGTVEYSTEDSIGPFEGPCDIGFMASTSAGTAEVAVNFEVIID